MKNKRITKRIIIILILLCFLILLTQLIRLTFSRFESNATSSSNIPVAFYVLSEGFQNMNLNLDSLIPRNEPYVYTFTISNSNGEQICNTDMEYTLKIRTTTNLPLEYNLFMNQDYTDSASQSIIETNQVEKDSSGTYFRIITTQKQNFSFKQEQTNTYQLVVNFPEKYNTIDYQDVIEGIEITIDSRQIIE